jgi:sn-glycerol 3-phosphate transport system permease protein
MKQQKNSESGGARMVEKRGTHGILAHVIMILGVLIVAFPLYLAFVASTHTAQEIVQAPMPLLPGSNIIDSYKGALFGRENSAAPTPRWRT